MKKFFVFLFLVFLTVFQATFGWPNIILVLLLFSFNFFSLNFIFWLTFLLGLLLDLMKGNFLGISSLGFLIISFLFWRYQQKINFRQPLVLMIFVFLVSLGWEKVFSGVFDFKKSFFLIILVLILNFIEKIFNLSQKNF